LEGIRLNSVQLAVSDDGTLYVLTGSGGGVLAALDQDLNLLWTFNARGQLDRQDPSESVPRSEGIGPSVLAVGDDGTVYFGTRRLTNYEGHYQNTGFIFAVDREGSLRWNSMLPFVDVVSGPVIGSDGAVLIGVSNPPDNSFGRVLALDPGDGSELWYADVEPNPLLAIAGEDRIYRGGGFGTITAFSGTGEKVWEIELDEDISLSEVTEPAVAPDGTVFCVAGGNLYAVNPEGEIVWETGSDSDNQVLIAGDDLIYTYSTRGEEPLTAYNMEGEKLWQFPKENEEDPSLDNGFAFINTPVFGLETGIIGLVEGYFDNALVHITTGVKGPAPEAPWPMPGRNNRSSGAMELTSSIQTPLRISESPVTRSESALPGGLVRGNSARTGEYPGSLNLGAQKVAWETENKLLDAVAVTGDQNQIYYGGIRRSSGYVAAVDPVSGEEIWRFEAPPGGAVTVTQSAVFFGTYSHYLAALDRSDGSLLWTYPAGGPVLSSPVVFEGKAVFIGNDRTLRSVDAVNGKLEWETAVPEYAGDSSPALMNGVLYLHADLKTVKAFDFETGENIWTYTLERRVRNNYWKDKNPAIADGKVFGISGEIVFALDAETGEELWLNDVSASGSPLYTDGTLYIPAPWGITVVDPDDGTEIGRIELPSGSFKITGSGNFIFASSSAGVFGVRKADGSRVFSSKWGDKRIEPQTEVSIIGDKLYVITKENLTYRTNRTYALTTE
jgi:outer membrane protein assembly factor BamB